MYSNYNTEEKCLNPSQLHIFYTMRRLWNEHVLWTRQFIVSSIFNNPDLEAVTQRLLRNPSDFGMVLRPFYGNRATQEFVELLTDHLLIAAALVDAGKAADIQEYDRQRRLWFENAEMIARLLASINPYWSQREWRDMLFKHLELLEDAVVMILNKEYEKGVAQYDLIQAQAYEMGDVMAKGIIRQFGL
ncbi:MAG TPA: acetylglutamate kinase [Clostridia bacterium]